MEMSLFGKVFGDANARYIKSIWPLVHEVNALEQEYGRFSDEKLKELTQEFRRRIADGPSTSSGLSESLDAILPEAFATVREAAKRTLKQRHFDVQLIGGIVLHQGKIGEMKTGEGKTLVATLPLYLNSLAGKGAHLVTPNDYLSRVGAGWMGTVYSMLGVSVGVVTHDSSGIYDPEYNDAESHGDERLNHFRPASRTEAYGADITYGTNNEFGFDYLRDNLEYLPDQLRQRPPYFAIVDEVDSILIDEARTPLIISAPDAESADLYRVFSRITPQLKEGSDYNVDEKLKAVSITEEGIDKIEKILGIGNIYEEKGMRFVHHLEQALRAQALFQKDRNYVVKDGQVIIVDEFTGRLMPGRRWSEGLHQAIEAKEGVQVQQESRTLATITFQNYFRMYEKLSGMTGTAQTSAEEFSKVYSIDVITIPTNKPLIREDNSDSVFRTEHGKFQAVVREVKERRERGQPVLIGTVSIEKNERLSKMLQVAGIPYELLNAKNHEREALIIAQAGQKGAVTVATNMAGRGVDIILGGTTPDSKEAGDVRQLGGLHVIGTERHEARRIDNQLRGRAGRQGDPGSSSFFVSLEDDVMRIFGSDKIKRMMENFGIPEDQPIENKMVSKAIESAQAKIEGFHFDARKHVLEFDDVLNKQRETIYKMRKEILFSSQNPAPLGRGSSNEIGRQDSKSQKPKERILEMVDEEITKVVEFHTTAEKVDEWNIEEIAESVRALTGIQEDVHKKLRELLATELIHELAHEQKQGKVLEYLLKVIHDAYAEKEKNLGEEGMRNTEKVTLLRSIDMLWMEHLDQMEHLRDSVRLRAYGQRDPLVEYKNEGAKLYHELQGAIRAQVVGTIFKVGGGMRVEQPRQMEERRPDRGAIQLSAAGAQATGGDSREQVSSIKKNEPSRNEPCPCGSGKKYKKCHGLTA
jgi:preprotein translocase subunit SecA